LAKQRRIAEGRTFDKFQRLSILKIEAGRCSWLEVERADMKWRILYNRVRRDTLSQSTAMHTVVKVTVDCRGGGKI